MMQQQEEWKLGYNEVVVDGPSYVEALPGAIEAVVYRARAPQWQLIAEHTFYKDFQRRFGPAAAPLLLFDEHNWDAPFAAPPC
eukprot:2265553-Pleurochrysis_carterae.AAC.1